ncbi:MAG: hypothetical protein PF487_07245 [Bacteroidales bacterium]|jgi:hypothetical protein|nr:hypothetical protein [Bacteroidales bacterium]
MDKFKIYNGEFLGEKYKFVKVKVEFVLEVPINEHINNYTDESITNEQMQDNLFKLERDELGETLLNNADSFKPNNKEE